ncbi:RNA polymerase sigma factor (sigma-70 family) [Mycetocola sp. BIGb0189]|uniref:RNA polymerase sigma factor n=1 Tax=Mycetocola sp. BIGb0189 TaxID=2940604 RepID=UPI002167732E|nr:RNA polymerase sigma factor [Mycetocola sp. BIGb0189]MCS4275967.1 RNA polymerase sigma factor (sigma-70 family) [Mycetocola sp. BIGb0189]
MPTPLPFETAIETHGATVLRVCRAVLGGHVDAEDAWAETFVAALADWDRIARIENVRGWLVTVAHRKAIDVLRAKGKQGPSLDVVPETPTTLGIPEATHLDLYRAIALLPPGQRTAITLHYLAGLPYAEVAAETGISPAAARRAGADGVHTLRATLTLPFPIDTDGESA